MAATSSVNGSFEFKSYKPVKGEEYMNPAQLAHFRHLLVRWKERLMQGADNTVVHMKTVVSSYADMLDEAAQATRFNLELRRRDRERKLIKKIDSSLTLVEEGDYGYCDECAAKIGIPRLEARPTATKCIDCKTFAEIREKQVGA